MQFFHGLPPDRDPEGASEPIIGQAEGAVNAVRFMVQRLSTIGIR